MVIEIKLFESTYQRPLDFFVGLEEERSFQKKGGHRRRIARSRFGCESKCKYMSKLQGFIDQDTLKFITMKRQPNYHCNKITLTKEVEWICLSAL